MPDPKLLEQALLSRPQINGPVNLPEGDPSAPEAQILRFMGGMVGDQKPGDLASALGSGTTLSLPLLSKLGKLLPGRAAEDPMAQLMQNLTKGSRSMTPTMAGKAPNTPFSGAMREFAPTTQGQQTPLTIGEMNKMLALQGPDQSPDPGALIQSIRGHFEGPKSFAMPRSAGAPMSNGEVMRRMEELKKFRNNAATMRGEK